MRIATMKLGLVAGLFLAALAGCSGSGAEPPQQPSGSTTAAANGTTVAANDHATRFVQRFDKNGNGKVELTELPERMQKHLASADTNKDGAITVLELKAHAEARKEEMWKRADKNGDGALDASEVGPEHWEHIKVADADGNGSVTKAEMEQAHASGKLAMMHHGKWGEGPRGERPSPEAMFQHMDKNGDGVIKADEVDPRFWAHISKADTNGDGAVSQDELKAAHAKFDAERREGRDQEAPKEAAPSETH